MGRYFRLLLDDYSSPSFTSFDKDYFGTLEDLAGFFRALKADEVVAQRQAYVLSIFDEYLAGKKTISHSVAYRDVPFLVPAKVLGEDHSVLTNHSWEHRNIWDCIYNMKCDKVESTHLWFSCYGQYTRCVQSRFTNLMYSGSRDFRELNGSAWGYPHQIEFNEPFTYSRLFVVEKTFKNKAQALNDRINFLHDPDPIFKGVLDDIFGDG